MDMEQKKNKKVALIVAHPDDETLWAGGLLLDNPHWDCFVLCLCRKNDPDRAPRFYRALDALDACGVMGDLDDGPALLPRDLAEIRQLIRDLLHSNAYDLIITHSPFGEYTRHLRHEEIGTAVMSLWGNGELDTKGVWLFAYEDEGRTRYPHAINGASVHRKLPVSLWKRKYNIITAIYGFSADSWEAKTTPGAEAFWCFDDKDEAARWLLQKNTTL